MDEHNSYGIDFIEAVHEIKKRCPYARTSGGISNVSFSFRGNNLVREAMHACFLYHACQAGLDMGIVNAGMLTLYDEVDPTLKEKVEAVILNKSPLARGRAACLCGTNQGSERRTKIGRPRPFMETETSC